jgi:crotonobetainyl-CoA:carnitine CoA-transferase CaiB-like acyl-CoA transferase
MTQSNPLPLSGIRVVEFTHMVMGPTHGLVLADLGAEVIKVEPLKGDNTRNLLGSGAGFYPLFNRNKKSLSIDLKTDEGREIIYELLTTSDVMAHNFRPETMAAQGLDYDTVKRLNDRIIYVALKGFLPGPYENRTALDEVVQMMGGLAYMTGPVGQPLRAGSSVNDIMGGMFGAIGTLAALMQRRDTGKGQLVESALYENNIWLVAQHMMQFAVTGKAADPMPNRISAWGVYDVFTVKNGEQIFLSAVSDSQWKIFCEAFKYDDLFCDARLKTNNERVRARDWLIPELRVRMAKFTAAELTEIFENCSLPYAPINKPHDLFDDVHLNESGGLAPTTLPDGRETKVPLLPLQLNGQRLALRNDPPQLGADTSDLLAELGYGEAARQALVAANVVRIGCV